MFENFPYSNFHDLNTDWIVKKIKDVETSEANAKASEENAKASELNASLSDASAQTWALQANNSVKRASEQAQASAQSAAEADNYVTSTRDQVNLLQSRVDNIIPSGTQTEGNTELLDIRVEYDGTIAKSAGNAVRAQIGELKNIIDISGIFSKTNLDGSYWQQGWYGSSTGIWDSSHNNAICLKNYIPSGTIKLLSCSDSYKMRLHAWDSNDTYIGVWNGNTFITATSNFYFQKELNIEDLFAEYPNYKFKVVLFADDETSAVVPSDGVNAWYSFSRAEEQNGINNSLIGVRDYTSTTWEIGSILSANGEDFTYNFAIRTPNTNRLYIDTPIVATSRNSEIAAVYAFKYAKNGAFVERIGTSGVKTITINSVGYYRFLLMRTRQIAITDVSEFSSKFYAMGNILSELMIGNFDDAVDYAIASDFTKTPLIMEKLNGGLRGIQAFCKYNGHYYSTDGSAIYEQDETLTLVNTYTLALGHGNAMQLGSNGIAYISGWDDNNVYVVDLSNGTITNTINLPTTGYTTCAVDDVNGLVYIFQRESRPATIENYNLIVYDYINNEIKNTKKITRAFGAMQSCDFVDGRIFILYGIGTSELPNGYLVLNTSGDIIGEYVLGTFATTEPEGVFVNRDTHIVEISLITSNVYKIKQSNIVV